MNDLILEDRKRVIQITNDKYNLNEKAYLSFSGGKDSTILHYLLDMAIPNNKIPRVFIDTGIEYNYIREFVYELAKNDNRFVIIKPQLNIKNILDKYGYPFKSKQHSHNLAIYQRSGHCKSVDRYLGIIDSNTLFRCPKILEYQFTNDFNIKISDECCKRLKKVPVAKWQKDNNKSIVITGMRKSEGGQRASLKGCIITGRGGNIIKFHPLIVVDDDWENWFIKEFNIKLCKLYYPPYNFKRTGCKGCPFSLDLQNQLDTMKMYLPSEEKQCEYIWKPVYNEYRKLNYRLDDRITIFD